MYLNMILGLSIVVISSIGVTLYSIDLISSITFFESSFGTITSSLIDKNGKTIDSVKKGKFVLEIKGLKGKL